MGVQNFPEILCGEIIRKLIDLCVFRQFALPISHLFYSQSLTNHTTQTQTYLTHCVCGISIPFQWIPSPLKLTGTRCT